MYCKTITYTDYDGNKHTEDYYFNISKAELLEMEMERDGGMIEYLNTIVEAENPKEVINVFKEFIRRSIGKKSVDGKRFMKNQEITDNFMASEAYSELFMELITNAEESANFINRIIPQDLAAEAATKMAKDSEVQTPPPVQTIPTALTVTPNFQPPMQAPMPGMMSNPQPDA